MHIFLQGPPGVGKSLVIRKTLALLGEKLNISGRIGGFVTYKPEDDDSVYICPAYGVYSADTMFSQNAEFSRSKVPLPEAENTSEALCVAQVSDGKTKVYNEFFDIAGVNFTRRNDNAALLIMDELGFLESSAKLFQQEVYKCLDGDIPILGVLRDREIAWHEPIKAHPNVSIVRVSEDNRDELPQKLAELLGPGD